MAFNVNQGTFELLYYRLKDSPYYPLAQGGVILLVSVILVVQAIIPQLSSLFSINAEIKATRDRIEILEENIAFVNRLDGAGLDEDIAVVYKALPPEKDFQGIIEAVNGAVVQSGVLVDNYSFEIGEIASESADLETFFSVDFTLAFTADMDSSSKFFEKLQESLPVGAISEMSLDTDTKSLSLTFYFKAYPQQDYNVGAPVKPMSEANRILLTTLRERKNSMLVFDDQPASSSAESPF